MAGRSRSKASWKEREELQERLKEAELMVAKLKLETSTCLWKSRHAQVEPSTSSGRSQSRRRRRETAPRSHTDASSVTKPSQEESCDSNQEGSTSYESCKEPDSSGEETCPMFEKFVRLGVGWTGAKDRRKKKENSVMRTWESKA